MKKNFIIISIFLAISSCSKVYDKGKKSDFSFRKCSNCKISND